MKKGIEYADKSWNPYSGCEGIDNERTGVVVGNKSVRAS